MRVLRETGKAAGVPFLAPPTAVDPYAAPAHVLDHLHQIDRLTQVKSLHGTIDPARLELGGLVDHHATG